MLRTLIDYARLLLDSPWLMLLLFAVVILPGGIVLTPVLASKFKRAKAIPPAQGSNFMGVIAVNEPQRLSLVGAKSSFKPFAPSVGKLQ